MLQLSDFTYHLPSNLIAHQPIEPRDSSKLLRLNRETGEMTHHHFSDLDTLLRPGDVLVRNNTKVIPARIYGHKTTGGAVEVLLSKAVHHGPESETWECLTKPGLKPGQTVIFNDGLLQATCSATHEYTRELTFNAFGSQLFDLLDQIGHTPIPPYIEWDSEDPRQLKERYQTVYATQAGSAAAPTAGLHFTPELIQRLAAKGVSTQELTLHVGLGTFLPVKAATVDEHHMHSEQFQLSAPVAQFLTQAKRAGRRIIAVGTTTTRVLEHCCQNDGTFVPQSGETAIFIYPPYHFNAIDGLITNFHLPESTLLMLVSALVSHPNTPQHFTHFQNSSVGHAYQTAIKNSYRFYSFGDAMFIV